MNTKTQPSILSDLFIGNFGEVVNDMFEEEKSIPNRIFKPIINFVENETSFVLTAEVPGAKKDDITISVENEILYVRGERKAPETKQKIHIQETRYGTFQRAIQLPKKSNTNGIAAIHQDGVLTVSIPKQEETLPRTIEIK